MKEKEPESMEFIVVYDDQYDAIEIIGLINKNGLEYLVKNYERFKEPNTDITVSLPTKKTK